MSRRQLKRLQGGKGVPEVSLEENEDDDIDEQPTKPRQSLFATLAALEDDDDDENSEDDAAGQSDRGKPAKEDVPPAVVASSAPKKKRKNKKKGKKAQDADVATTEDKGRNKGKGKGKGKQDDGLDEIDRALKELDLKEASALGASTSVKSPTSAAAAAEVIVSNERERKISELLKINPYNLKVQNEMKALFGKDTVAAAEAEDQSVNPAARPPQQRQQLNLEDVLRAPPGQGLKELSITKNYLIQGKKTWPMATTGGLTMKAFQGKADKADKANKGAKAPPTEYAFVHDESYNTLEKKFFAYSSTYSPDLMVEFLQKNPYHISSLLIVSKIAKHQGDHALAADLRERALFTFARIMLSGFKHNIEDGQARLNFARPENRQFWLAGQQYLRSLLRRGTYKTALEWAKLLLMMDPADPYAICHYLPVVALKAKEFQWLIDFSKAGGLASQWGYADQTVALAKLRLGDERGAMETTRAGMKEFPWLYSELFKTLDMDVPKAIWGATVPFGADDLYTAVYIHQTKEVWNYPKATQCLFEAAHGFDRPPCKLQAKRVTLGIARMVYLEEIPELMSKVPHNMLHSQPNFEFDPLPPAMEDNIFSSQIQRAYFQNGGADLHDEIDPAEFATANAAAAGRGLGPEPNSLGRILRLLGITGDGGGPAPGDQDAILNSLMQAAAEPFDDGSSAQHDEYDLDWDDEEYIEGNDEYENEFGFNENEAWAALRNGIQTAGGENLRNASDDEMPPPVDADAPVRSYSMGPVPQSDSDDDMPGLMPVADSDSDDDMPGLVHAPSRPGGASSRPAQPCQATVESGSEDSDMD